MELRNHFDRLFSWAENAIYLLIGIILLMAVLFLFYDVIMSFFRLHDSLVREIVEVLDKTLLIMMMVEILYTIRISLKEHVLNPEPFIIVAMIAAIRRILVISVEVAYEPEMFTPYMIEISILGVLIPILVGSIILMRRLGSQPGIKDHTST